MEDVVYMYKPNREADFLQDLLSDFKGVLVTDFYAGYESLPCEQQKCLVHLIRDFNSDLKSNPYDEEFKTLAAEFGKLLRSIVDTIDRYGLKKRHLHRYQAKVGRFFRAVEARVYRSELAEGYQKRLLKNEGKLFTFLDHDGVPWNNNNAEHSIKAFAKYRRIFDGQLTEGGLSDYLVLLSVYQTCKYRGVNFLRFLLSQQEDVEAFCRRGGKKKRPPGLEVYPKGFHRKYRDRSRDRSGRGRACKGLWKPEILAFLRQQGESGASRCEIVGHCIGLIKSGRLVTVVSADDRPRVAESVSVCLTTMTRAGEVARTLDGMHCITACGLAWLERVGRPADEPA